MKMELAPQTTLQPDLPMSCNCPSSPKTPHRESEEGALHLAKGTAADLKQKLCKGENKSAAHPQIHPPQQGSQSKDAGDAQEIRRTPAANALMSGAISSSKH